MDSLVTLLKEVFCINPTETLIQNILFFAKKEIEKENVITPIFLSEKKDINPAAVFTIISNKKQCWISDEVKCMESVVSLNAKYRDFSIAKAELFNQTNQ